MNLLHIIPYYAPAWAYGGAVRAAADLTRALAEAGHNVVVLTTDTLSPTERIESLEEVIGGVRVIRVRNWSNSLRGRLNLSTPIRIQSTARQLVHEHAIQIAHAHEVRTVENLRLAPLLNRLDVPLVVSPHGTLPYETGRQSVKRLWDRLFARRLLPRFDRVIGLTASEATDARAVWSAWDVPLPDDRISIVPNGVHLIDFEHLPPADAARARWNLGGGPVLLFLGRLHERKGLQYLIPAFADAVRLVPDARLLIAGPDEGMRPTLDAQIAQFDLAGRVIFTGMLAGEDKLAALAAADMFALPAVGEGFSMAVLEAMACGLPVLLTPGCNFPEVIDAGAGIVVAREVDALRGGLCALLTDPERRASMGRAARDLVRARYTWPQVVTQLEAVYQNLIDRRTIGQ